MDNGSILLLFSFYFQYIVICMLLMLNMYNTYNTSHIHYLNIIYKLYLKYKCCCQTVTVNNPFIERTFTRSIQELPNRTEFWTDFNVEKLSVSALLQVLKKQINITVSEEAMMEY